MGEDLIGKLIFIVRIKTDQGGIHPLIEKILKSIRLYHNNSGVFLVVTKKVYHMIGIVEPYVTFGYPNQKSILELIRKRGHTKIDGKRTALNNNLVIEQKFGEHDILCVEDMVHEVSTIGPKFVQITKFMLPFKLTLPPGGFANKNRQFANGGDHGNRADQINELIELMN